jgi:hypothetical protein
MAILLQEFEISSNKIILIVFHIGMLGRIVVAVGFTIRLFSDTSHAIANSDSSINCDHAM